MTVSTLTKARESTQVLDDELVFVESLAGEQVLDGEQITPIIQAFEAVRRAALTGADAMALIQRVATELSTG